MVVTQPSTARRPNYSAHSDKKLPSTRHCRLHVSLAWLSCHVSGWQNDLDSKIPHRALQLGVTQQKLYSPEVLGSPVNQRCLRASQAMRAVSGSVKPDILHPRVQDPC